MGERSEEAIINILQEQIKSYKALLVLLKEEKECLVNIKPDKVSELSKEKDTIVMRLRLLEEERVRLVNEFVRENQISGKVNLKQLATITGNDDFITLRSKLVSLLQNVEEMNKFNSLLIDRSINYIKTTTSFFGTFSEENAAKTTGVLLSKET
jgi:flagellar biosynthesis/type III secretory pathway chaperone